jgi:hypothetical protein
VPVVQLYVSGFEPNIDRTFDLTADEARQLGVHLLAAADLLAGSPDNSSDRMAER